MDEQKFRNALPIGFQLNEYRIESVLGKSGGFGITYLATDTNLSISVAIKEFLPSDIAIREGQTVYARSPSDEEAFKWGLNRFIEEARILARFNHPNIVRVLRFFEANGTGYMVMEYQKGKNLNEYIDHQTLTEKELLDIIDPLLDGLKEIHKAGFLHRDIKPTNIYIRDDKTPILIDFGSARYAIGQRTSMVTSIVTPGYAPIEQYDNEMTEQGPWTDIYAMGGVVYFMISGEAPVAATRRIMDDPLVSIETIGQGKYSRHLLKSIDWALEPNKEDRPQSIEEWREKIATRTIPSPTVKNTWVRARTRKTMYTPQSWFLYLSVGIILLLTTVIVMLFYQNKEIIEQNKEITEQLTIEKTNREIAQETASIIRKFDAELAEGKEPNATQCQKHKFIKKYYDVVDVAKDDALNIREFPTAKSAIMAKIPSGRKCLLYLDKFKFNGDTLWVMIEHLDDTEVTQGWVNSDFLAFDGECPQLSPSPSDTQKQTDELPTQVPKGKNAKITEEKPNVSTMD